MEEIYRLYDADKQLEFRYYEGLEHDYLPEQLS